MFNYELYAVTYENYQTETNHTTYVRATSDRDASEQLQNKFTGIKVAIIKVSQLTYTDM